MSQGNSGSFRGPSRAGVSCFAGLQGANTGRDGGESTRGGRVKAIVVLVACALVGVLAGYARGAARPTSAYHDLADAVRRGDATTARELTGKMKLDSATIRVMNDQLDYDMPKLLSDALACRDESSAMSSPGGCNLLAYSAAMVMGDAHATFQALHWARSARGSRGSGDSKESAARFDPAFVRVDVARLAKELPLTRIRVSPVKTSLAYLDSPCGVTATSGAYVAECKNPASMRPKVEITVDGKSTAALLDTGAPFAVVMSHERAEEFGATPLVTDLAPLTMLGKTRPEKGPSSLYLVDHLTFGSLNAHNLMVVVLPDGVLQGAGVVLGLPMLARFGEVTFGRSRITLGTSPARCVDRLPLTFASSFSQQGKLVFPAQADGKHVSATIDTGSSAALIAGRALAPRLVASSSSGPKTAGSHDNVLHRYLRVSFGKKEQLSYNSAPVIPSLTVTDVVIGAPVLSTMNMQLNFSEMWLCMTPASSMRVSHHDHRPN